MSRYWVSWWSKNVEPPVSAKMPFTFWVTGVKGDGSASSICAVIDAKNKGEIERRVPELVDPLFLAFRFIKSVAADFTPGPRMAGSVEKTSLYFDEEPTAVQYQSAEPVFQLIRQERALQDKKWGAGRDLPDHLWYTVSGEEHGEIARAMLEGDNENLEEELIQLAALCVAWVECLRKRRNADG